MKAKYITATLTMGALAALFILPIVASAHGTMLVPESRIYNCRFNDSPENPSDPACRAAVQVSGPQMLYDWNGVNQAVANSNSRNLIPDGQLCSGGKPGFKGMDVPRSDWKATPVQKGAFEFQYYATAPHATKDTILYITKNGWTPNQSLRWADLEEFCRVGQQPLVTGAQGKNVYKMNCALPARTGRHVIYSIWQRSDSTEAFYSCNDVQYSGGSGSTPTPVASYKAIGVVGNSQNLPVGTKLSFRLFDDNGSDIETIRIILAAGQNSKTNWPYVLAKAVNAQSAYARIGVMDAGGAIVPSRQLNGNLVFIAASQNLSFVIDKSIPAPTTGTGTGGQPGTAGTFVYPNGIGSYKPGTVVRGTDDARYQCRPYPMSGWCNQALSYYAPGTGWAWRDAWVKL